MRELDINERFCYKHSNMSDVVSIGEGEEKIVGVKVFLAGGCREDILVIKDEEVSVLVVQCIMLVDVSRLGITFPQLFYNFSSIPDVYW